MARLILNIDDSKADFFIRGICIMQNFEPGLRNAESALAKWADTIAHDREVVEEQEKIALAETPATSVEIEAPNTAIVEPEEPGDEEGGEK